MESRVGVNRWLASPACNCRHRIIREEQEEATLSPEEITRSIFATRDDGACFKKARPCPLWIFSSSAEVARAVAWAHGQRLDIPRACPLASLDNDSRFYHLGLTSCGPDWDAIGYLMAHAVVGDFPVAKTGKGFIRTTAAVIEKLTTPS